MSRGVAGDVGDGLLHAVHDANGQDEVVILGIPILLGRGGRGGQNGARALVTAEGEVVFLGGLRQHGEEGLGYGAMAEQGLDGVADRGAGALGIDRDGQRLGKVGSLVHVEVAVACTRLNDGHARILHHRANQSLATAGDEDVHQSPHIHEGGRTLAVGHADKSDQIGRKSVLCEGGLHGLHQSRTRMDGLLTAAQNHGVARLEGEGGGIHRNVGACLVDHSHASHGCADVTNAKAVGTHGLLTRADGIGQGGDLAQSIADGCEARLGQLQAIQHGGGNAVLGGQREVGGVGLQDAVAVGREAVGHSTEQGVFAGGVGRAVGAGRLLGGGADRLNVRADGFGHISTSYWGEFLHYIIL